MAWECRELDAFEVCPQGLPERIILNSLSKRQLLSCLEEARSESAESMRRVYSTWRELAQDYSQCALSFTTDKAASSERPCSLFW